MESCSLAVMYLFFSNIIEERRNGMSLNEESLRSLYGMQETAPFIIHVLFLAYESRLEGFGERILVTVDSMVFILVLHFFLSLAWYFYSLSLNASGNGMRRSL